MDAPEASSAAPVAIARGGPDVSAGSAGREGAAGAPTPVPDAGRARLQGHLALVVVQFCFGLFPVFGLLAMDPGVGFEAFGVASWRILSGSALLGAVALFAFGKRAIPPREHLGLLLTCALLGIVLNQGLFLSGLHRSTAMNAGLVMCLIPVFTFLIAALSRQEAFSWTRALGVGVAFLGTVPLFFGRGAEWFGDHSLGNALMALNTLSYAGYLVLSKRLTAHHPPLLVMSWVYVFSLPFLPLFLWRTSLLPADTGSFAVWSSLGYVVVFATVLGYLLNVFALGRVRASTTAIYVYMQPLITATAGYLVLDEEPAPGMVRAAALLFLGIALVSRRPRARAHRSPA